MNVAWTAKISKTLDAFKDTSTSQDPIDSVAGEYAIADAIASYANSRKDRAKKHLVATISKDIDATKTRAEKHLSKQSTTLQGAEKLVIISCNAPAQTIDVDVLCNYLVKRGLVDVAKLNEAKEVAKTYRSPATSFTIAQVGDGNGK